MILCNNKGPHACLCDECEAQFQRLRDGRIYRVAQLIIEAGNRRLPMTTGEALRRKAIHEATAQDFEKGREHRGNDAPDQLDDQRDSAKKTRRYAHDTA